MKLQSWGHEMRRRVLTQILLDVGSRERAMVDEHVRLRDYYTGGGLWDNMWDLMVRTGEEVG